MKKCAKPEQPINKQILMQSAICRALPRNAHIIMDNLPQSIMASLLNSAGLSYDIVVTESMLNKYGFELIEMFDSAEIPLLCLGAESWHLRLTARVEAGFSNLSQGPRTIDVQTVDEAFSGMRRISWLALESIDLLFLDNAKNCIEEHRPLISLVFDGKVNSLLQWCEVNQYSLVDASLNPVSSKNASEQKYYLFPTTALLEEVAQYLEVSDCETYLNVADDSKAIHKWPLLCKAGDGLAKLTANYIQTNTRQYPLSSMLATGLFPLEIEGGTEWRWTGPGHDTKILMPMRAHGLYRISLTVLAIPEGVSNTTVRCFMNGAIALEQTVEAGTEIVFDYVADQPEFPAELLISVSNTQDCWGRVLGIAISGIQVAWGDTK